MFERKEEHNYRSHFFVQIANKIPSKEFIQFILSHERNLRNMTIANEIIQIFSITKEKYKVNSYQFLNKEKCKKLSDFLENVFENQFKSIFKFDDLCALFNIIDDERKMRLIVNFEHLIINCEQLNTLLKTIQDNSIKTQLILKKDYLISHSSQLNNLFAQVFDSSVHETIKNQLKQPLIEKLKSGNCSDQELVFLFSMTGDISRFMKEEKQRINAMSSPVDIIEFIMDTIDRDFNDATKRRPPEYEQKVRNNFAPQFKTILKYDNLRDLLSRIAKYKPVKGSLDYVFDPHQKAMSWLYLMPNLIANESQLMEILNIFGDREGSMGLDSFLKEVENCWYSARCRLEFMTGAVDKDAHSHVFFKTLGSDAFMFTKEIFEMAGL